MGPIGLSSDFSLCAVQTDILQLRNKHIFIKFLVFIDIFTTSSHTREEKLIICIHEKILHYAHIDARSDFSGHIHKLVVISPVLFRMDTL